VVEVKLTDGTTTVTVNVTAMKVRQARRKEMITAPGGIEPIYLDMGREPVRVDFEAIASASDGRQLIQWCSQGTTLKVTDAPAMFPTYIGEWVLESADIEGLKGNQASVKARCILVEKTELTFV